MMMATMTMLRPQEDEGVESMNDNEDDADNTIEASNSSNHNNNINEEEQEEEEENTTATTTSDDDHEDPLRSVDDESEKSTSSSRSSTRDGYPVSQPNTTFCNKKQKLLESYKQLDLMASSNPSLPNQSCPLQKPPTLASNQMEDRNTDINVDMKPAAEPGSGEHEFTDIATPKSQHETATVMNDTSPTNNTSFNYATAELDDSLIGAYLDSMSQEQLDNLVFTLAYRPKLELSQSEAQQNSDKIDEQTETPIAGNPECPLECRWPGCKPQFVTNDLKQFIKHLIIRHNFRKFNSIPTNDTLQQNRQQRLPLCPTGSKIRQSPQVLTTSDATSSIDNETLEQIKLVQSIEERLVHERKKLASMFRHLNLIQKLDLERDTNNNNNAQQALVRDPQSADTTRSQAGSINQTHDSNKELDLSQTKTESTAAEQANKLPEVASNCDCQDSINTNHSIAQKNPAKQAKSFYSSTSRNEASMPHQILTQSSRCRPDTSTVNNAATSLQFAALAQQQASKFGFAQPPAGAVSLWHQALERHYAMSLASMSQPSYPMYLYQSQLQSAAARNISQKSEVAFSPDPTITSPNSNSNKPPHLKACTDSSSRPRVRQPQNVSYSQDELRLLEKLFRQENQNQSQNQVKQQQQQLNQHLLSPVVLITASGLQGEQPLVDGTM